MLKMGWINNNPSVVYRRASHGWLPPTALFFCMPMLTQANAGLFLSGSGVRVGQFGIRVSASRGEAFEDLCFRQLFGRGCASTVPPAGSAASCGVPKSDELCLDVLTAEHAHSCQTGAGRMRPHRNVLLALADELRLMGGYVESSATALSFCGTALTALQRRRGWTSAPSSLAGRSSGNWMSRSAAPGAGTVIRPTCQAWLQLLVLPQSRQAAVLMSVA